MATQSVRPETRGREDACCLVGASRTRGRANIIFFFARRCFPVKSRVDVLRVRVCVCVYAAKSNVVLRLTCSNKHRDSSDAAERSNGQL